tara:strand:+ start:166 stop:534 length:369 start_codon:yes stop_codon:yes gene_type:complete
MSEVEIQLENSIIEFLKNCGFQIDNLDNLNGMMINRKQLLDKNKYIDLTENIVELRELISSSYLTGLQETAIDKQKYPLVNVTRQILKLLNYELKPYRMSAGYDHNTGKKLYERYYVVIQTK